MEADAEGEDGFFWGWGKGDGEGLVVAVVVPHALNRNWKRETPGTEWSATDDGAFTVTGTGNINGTSRDDTTQRFMRIETTYMHTFVHSHVQTGMDGWMDRRTGVLDGWRIFFFLFQGGGMGGPSGFLLDKLYLCHLKFDGNWTGLDGLIGWTRQIEASMDIAMNIGMAVAIGMGMAIGTGIDVDVDVDVRIVHLSSQPDR